MNQIIERLKSKNITSDNAINEIHRCVYLTSKKYNMDFAYVFHKFFDSDVSRYVNIKTFKVTRDFCLIPIPYYVNIPRKDKILTQIFYKSTDTSNILGFKDIYFPSNKILPNGYIGKLGFDPTENEVPQWYVKLCRIFLNDLPDYESMTIPEIKSLMKKNNIYNKDDDKVSLIYRLNQYNKYTRQLCLGYESFLHRFDEWWQVTLSAILGGEFWNRPDMHYLKELALNYMWDDDINNFIEIPEKQIYIFPDKFDIDFSKEYNNPDRTIYKEIYKWLYDNNGLEKDFLYK